jgi:hypothetical protein
VPYDKRQKEASIDLPASAMDVDDLLDWLTWGVITFAFVAMVVAVLALSHRDRRGHLPPAPPQVRRPAAGEHTGRAVQGGGATASC